LNTYEIHSYRFRYIPQPQPPPYHVNYAPSALAASHPKDTTTKKEEKIHVGKKKQQDQKLQQRESQILSRFDLAT